MLNNRAKNRTETIAITVIVAFIVMVVTFYFLILPAITMTPEPICGNDSHAHTQECFENEVYITFICEQKEHQHSNRCYSEEKILNCEIDEHTHNNNCYKNEEVLICVEKHEHLDDCYDMEEILICEQKEHTHKDNCYDIERKLDCGNEVHQHTAKCQSIELASNNFDYGASNNKDEDNKNVYDVEDIPDVKETSQDLSKYITNIALQISKDGRDFTKVSNNNFEKDQIIRFILYYEIPKEILSEKNNMIVCDLDMDVIPKNELDGFVFNNESIVGSYKLSTNQQITIELNEKFIETNKEKNIEGSFHLDIDASDLIIKDNDNIVSTPDISDTDDKKDVQEIGTETGDIHIEATQSKLSDGIIKYTIKIIRDKSANTNIMVSSTMTNAVYDGEISLVAGDIKFDIENDKLPKNGDKSFDVEVYGFLASMGDITITYNAKLLDDFTDKTVIVNDITVTDQANSKIKANDFVIYPKTANITAIVSDNNDNKLNKTEFKLYKYSENDYSYVDTYTTNNDGEIDLSNLIYGSAYKLEQTTAVAGYKPSKPIDFYIMVPEIYDFPVNAPNYFSGKGIKRGENLEIINEKPLTNVSVVMNWEDANGIKTDDNIPESIEVKLYRYVIPASEYGNFSSKEEYLESVAYKTITLSNENSWSYIWEDLEEIGINSSNTLVYYEYMVDEKDISDYEKSISSIYDNNTNTYSFEITNRRINTFEGTLPATGANITTYIYYAIGVLCFVFVIFARFKTKNNHI